MTVDGSLEISGVVAGYGGTKILKGVDLTVRCGEAIAVLGPNGAGKSTLLNAISGLVRVYSGEVRLGQRALTNAAAHEIVRAGITQVPEGRQVFPEMTVRENLLLGAFTAEERKVESLSVVLDIFPVLKDRLRQDAQTLSGGEQQMLAIGRGLMAHPRFLLLDEPTLGLAPIIVDQLLEQLCYIRAHLETALLVVEQNAYLAKNLCSTFHLLVNGSFLAITDSLPEDPEELMSIYAESGQAP
jgi:branched-chain amino acid transport system ATP-binding protein